MTQLTDYAENKLVDVRRAQAWTLPGGLYAALASAASDSSISEITFTGYARQPLSRALATWAGTQSTGSTAASSGMSHTTSNNAAINFGTAGSAGSAAANYLVIYDAVTSGNAICFIPLASAPLTINNGDPVSFAAGTISFSIGLAGGCTDYLCNKLIDWIFRGQSFTWPATEYVGLFTAAPANAGGGTEVSGGSYARVAVTGSLANWAGTQGAGTLTASTGSTGKTSNNGTITFPAPTASWGAIGWQGIFDAASGGNLLFWAPLNTPRTVASGGSAPVFNAATLTLTFL